MNKLREPREWNAEAVSSVEINRFVNVRNIAPKNKTTYGGFMSRAAEGGEKEARTLRTMRDSVSRRAPGKNSEERE